MAAYRQMDGLVTCSLYTGISSGPTVGNEYGTTLPLPFFTYLNVTRKRTQWSAEAESEAQEAGAVRSGFSTAN